ncbi:hypothetical protein ACFWXO_18605 [Kitasatospora sp. NPDC059088]|uniref:hypothetical protein n=1 Tax=Kitasatospora sp. NPDC059088 TaxID=3346722 RepID=UPI0036A5226A
METADYLNEALRYSAPQLAGHGWARMVMYRVADAMDTIGLFVGEIAVELEQCGAELKTIRRLLKADQECLRTAQPVRVAGIQLTKRQLQVMPEWIVGTARNCLASVLLRLPVMLRSCVRPQDELWVQRCLNPMVDSMDQLGRLANLLATVHVDVLDEHVLRRYQQLFQQQPRAGMPYPEDHAFPLLSTWAEDLAGPESYEVRALALLAMLNERYDHRRWHGGGGDELRPDVRDAALATLNALEIEMSEVGDTPRYRLTDAEWAYAVAISEALRDWLASAVPDGDQPLIDILRAMFDRTQARSHQ